MRDFNRKFVVLFTAQGRFAFRVREIKHLITRTRQRAGYGRQLVDQFAKKTTLSLSVN